MHLIVTLQYGNVKDVAWLFNTHIHIPLPLWAVVIIKAIDGKIILSAIFVFIYCLPVAYAADCGNAGDAVSIMQSHEQRYIKAGKELNAIYRDVMKSLPENEKQKLQSAQKAWLKYRDANIDFVIEQNKENRSFGGISVSDYKASVVEKRVLELKHLLSGPEGEAVKW